MNILKSKFTLISISLIVLLQIPITALATITGERVEAIAAIVNDDIITTLELAGEVSNLKRELAQQPGITLPSEDELRSQVLDRMIIMRIQVQRAKRGNIRINDEAVNAAIENVAQKNNMDLMKFRQALESRGFDYSTYRERIREEMIIGQLQKRQVNNRIVVTEQEIDDFIAAQLRQGSESLEYRLEHILVVVPEAANPGQLQAAKQRAEDILKELKEGAVFSQVAMARSGGQQALSGGDLGWRKMVEIPSIFANVVQDLDVGEVSEVIRSPSGFHLIRLADKRADQQKHIIQQTKARHILITPSIEQPNEDVKIRMQQLKQRIKDGESFSNIAAAHSQDKGSATAGGELGWVNPGIMVKEFEEVMNKLKPGELSEPFRSRFGWHIVQVEERRDFDNTKFKQRNKARETLLKRKIEPAIENWIRQIRDEAFVEVRLKK